MSAEVIDDAGASAPPDLPYTEVPHFAHVPDASALWSRALLGLLPLLVLFAFDQIAALLANLWLLQRLGVESVFWTNFQSGATLFCIAFAATTAAVAAPAYLHRVSATGRRLAITLGAALGLVAGYSLSLYYAEFLGLFSNVPFDKVDPVFGKDISFFIFSLPPIWVAWAAVAAVSTLFLISSIACARRTELEAAPGVGRFIATAAGIATPTTRIAVLLLGVSAAVGIWISRYYLVFKHNKRAAIHNGAQMVDVDGPISSVVDYWVTAVMVLIGAVALERLIATLRATASQGADWKAPLKKWGLVLLVAVVADFGFKGLVSVRYTVLVRPNEPVIQIPYIQEHIDATRAGFGLDQVEVVTFEPKGPNDPFPDVDKMLKSATLRDAPLWPGFSTYLARVVDNEHSDRILQTAGDPLIYGPTLEVFQQRKLRPYYEFLNVDAVRYTIDGVPRMLVSAVRELPTPEWLDFWGQGLMLFTHGYGLAAAEPGITGLEGEPVYATDTGRLTTQSALVEGATQSIYYGEGATDLAFSNMLEIKEFDFPTAEGRAEVVLDADIETGIPVDSVLKRLVFGWQGDMFFEVLFSTLIGEDTRAHYSREPVVRLKQVAPFMYWDTNAYAVVADGQIMWMVNGLTVSDDYPSSKRRWMGDRGTGRTLTPEPFARVNYVRDAVKATVDAYTGKVTLYQISDEPIVSTWASIYPELFTAGDEMPDSIREHLQYPLPLYEIQFDDIYDVYHMDEVMTFYNREDTWAEGREVLGPILDSGQAITFRAEPYHWLAIADGNPLPKSDEPVQFAMSQPFTPETAKNLRAIPLVYQSGDDYGRLISLQVPKGAFSFGIEQADAAIDQETEIAEQISWWNRRGTDVIRGHTSALIVEGELIYIEPLFIRSQQNAVTQLKKVVVVFRGTARMGDSLEEALRLAVKSAKEDAQLRADAKRSG